MNDEQKLMEKYRRLRRAFWIVGVAWLASLFFVCVYAVHLQGLKKKADVGEEFAKCVAVGWMYTYWESIGIGELILQDVGVKASLETLRELGAILPPLDGTPFTKEGREYPPKIDLNFGGGRPNPPGTVIVRVRKGSEYAFINREDVTDEQIKNIVTVGQMKKEMVAADEVRRMKYYPGAVPDEVGTAETAATAEVNEEEVVE